jgi:hypothetical protein
VRLERRIILVDLKDEVAVGIRFFD